MSDRYEPYAPCPHCFESSGYLARYHHATWDDPAWEDADPMSPCPECGGTGWMPASEVGPDDERDEDFYDDDYLASLDAEAGAVRLGEIGEC
jgi:hypothetical protein